MARAMISSKWADTGAFEAMAVSAIASWVFFSICIGAGRFAANKDRGVGFVGVFVPLVIIASISIPMVFGNRMQTRFSTVTEDSATRINHWQKVLHAMDKDGFTSISGMGLGSFPRIFFQKDAHSRTLGTYSYETESGNGENKNGNGFLRLNGGKDMELGQRFYIAGDENGKYQLFFSARSAQKDAGISFRICRRNLLHAAGCKYYRIRLNNEFIGQWNTYTVAIEKNIIKQSPWYAGWPQVLLAAILGFQVVGLTDSPIDAPRVAFLYYMIVMMSFTQALEEKHA